VLIELKQAAFVYQAPEGEVEALRDISFSMAEGEFCSIVGPSGCGKSTLLSAIAGLEPLFGGSIAVDGEPVCGPTPKIGTGSGRRSSLRRYGGCWTAMDWQISRRCGPVSYLAGCGSAAH